MKLTPLKAIRKKCLDCSNDSKLEARECPIIDCPLYVYRLGKNPARSGLGNTKAVLVAKPELNEGFALQNTGVA